MKPFPALLTCTVLLLAASACSTLLKQTAIAPQPPSSSVQAAPAIETTSRSAPPELTAASTPTPAIDLPAALDDNCQPTQAGDGSWQIVYHTPFTAQGQSYVLIAANYQDGSVRLCVARSNMTQFQSIRANDIQGAYIKRIVPDPNRAAVFEIMLIDGNGGAAPIAQYELDLSNPAQAATRLLSRTAGEDLDNFQSIDRPIQFAAGATSTTVAGTIQDDRNIRYRLRAQAGQTMTLRLTSPDNRPNATPDVVFALFSSDDPSFACNTPGGCNSQAWTGELPTTGEYLITLSRPSISDHAPYQAETPYSLEVTIR